ncbi:MAG: hypothetical protein V3G42_08650 [Oscillospiraceae bacterium]
MTANTNNKYNHSARKKLIPAIAMLTVSAMTLASSTYAWFTMSREVEVSNIQMSATVPEDIQISLGALGTGKNAIGTTARTTSLKDNTGVLYAGTGNAVADDGAVVAPTNDWDWSNIADISNYYQMGKLIPASSTNGTNISFTPDADGVGKTVKSTASYYAAAIGGAKQLETGSNDTYFNARLHAITDKNGATVQDAWSTRGNDGGVNYTTSSAWNTTNDDGYYIDIPVWLRTSSTAGASLGVQAYVRPKSGTQTLNSADEALYRAIRVAILEVGGTDAAPTYTTKNLIPVTDGMSGITSSAAGSLSTSPFALGEDNTNVILDWYGRSTANVTATTNLDLSSGSANNAKAAVSEVNGTSGTYDKAVIYNKTNDTIELAAPAGSTSGIKTSNYGDAKKFIIRVWLEGEDPDCWNETAGQDWSINLKFTNNTATASDVDVDGVNTNINTPAAQSQDPEPQP